MPAGAETSLGKTFGVVSALASLGQGYRLAIARHPQALGWFRSRLGGSGKAINITEAEVHNVLTQSVQTIVLERGSVGMIEIPEAHQKAADFYRDFLRRAKRQGLDLNSAPAEIQQSMLALHQNAQSVWWAHRLNEREAARCQTQT